MTMLPFFRLTAAAETQAEANGAGAGASATSSDGCEIVGVKPAPQPPVQAKKLISRIGATRVKTPGNGSCVYHAVVAACSRTCGSSVNGADPVEIKVAESLRQEICGELRDNLSTLLYSGTLNLNVLSVDVFGRPTDAHTLSNLRAHYATAALQPCSTTVDRRYWGGETELKAFAFGRREPIYSLDVWPDGSTNVVRYAALERPLADGSMLTRVVRQEPTVAMFEAHIAVYRRHKVIPLMVMLEHGGAGSQHIGHYDAIRLASECYKAWTGTLRLQGAMRQRLPAVLIEIDIMNAAGIAHTPPPLEPARSFQPDSSSGYAPSSTVTSSASDRSGAEAVPGEAAGAETAQRLLRWDQDASVQITTAATGGETGVDAVLQASGGLRQDGSMMSILSSQPGLSYDTSVQYHPTSCVTPKSQMDPSEERRLLLALEDSKPSDDESKRSMKKAEKANNTAFGHWKRKMATERPPLHALLRECDDLKLAVSTLQEYPCGLQSLFRHLPFAAVLIATLPDSILVKAGRAVITSGRVQMLHRVQPLLPAKAQKMCRDWGAAIAMASLPDAKFVLAQDAAKWVRLIKAAQEVGVEIQAREQAELPDAAWSYMAAYVLLLPYGVPPAFAEHGFMQQCDALLTWAARPANAPITESTALALGKRQWQAVDEFLSHWEGDSHTAAAPPSASPCSGAAATPAAEGTDQVPAQATTTVVGARGAETYQHPASTAKAEKRQRGRARGQHTRGRRRRRGRQRRTPEDLVCVTQNLQGMAKHPENLEAWFEGLRLRNERGQADVVLLQETRAMEEAARALQSRHERGWGYDADRAGGPLSLWSPATATAGGVAMLFKPDSLLRAPRPLWQQHWTPWFMAAEAELEGGPITIVNVYGPSGNRKKEREALFTTLRELPRPRGRLLLGGDFNCTLDPELDRSHGTGADHGSNALQLLLEHWKLRDGSQDDEACVRTDADKKEYHARHHSYKYRLRNGDLASSRLDRWYVSEEVAGDVREVAAEPPVNRSDHDAVSLVIATTPASGRRRTRPQQRRLRYPLPHGCHDPVQHLSKTALTGFAEMNRDGQAAVTAQKWDECKTQIRQDCLRLIRRRLKQQRRAFQQRRKRLRLALRAALRIASRQPTSGTATIETITQQLDDLALDPHEKVMSIRRSITRLHRARAHGGLPGRHARS